jgi:hypothetical protein
LADETGLGKTLSMLLLVMETKPQARRWVEGGQGQVPTESLKALHATLVIVPSEGTSRATLAKSRLSLIGLQIALMSGWSRFICTLIVCVLSRFRSLTLQAHW